MIYLMNSAMILLLTLACLLTFISFSLLFTVRQQWQKLLHQSTSIILLCAIVFHLYSKDFTLIRIFDVVTLLYSSLLLVLISIRNCSNVQWPYRWFSVINMVLISAQGLPHLAQYNEIVIQGAHNLHILFALLAGGYYAVVLLLASVLVIVHGVSKHPKLLQNPRVSTIFMALPPLDRIFSLLTVTVAIAFSLLLLSLIVTFSVGSAKDLLQSTKLLLTVCVLLLSAVFIAIQYLRGISNSTIIYAVIICLFFILAIYYISFTNYSLY